MAMAECLYYVMRSIVSRNCHYTPGWLDLQSSRSAPRLYHHDFDSTYETSRRHTHIHDLVISRVCEIGHLQIGSKSSQLAGKRDVPHRIGTPLEPLNDSNPRIQYQLSGDLLRPVDTSIIDGVVEDVFGLEAVESALRSGKVGPTEHK